METLLCSNPSPLHLPKTPPTKPNPKNLNPHFTRTLTPKPETKSWRLLASAKGFSAAPKEPSRRPENKNTEPSKEEDDEPLPQEVVNRMMARILVSVGVPMAVGLAILKILGELKDNNLWDVPIWVTFFSSLVTFGASALGIAYGSLSTSLDPEKKGSVLGFKEAQENWVEMWKEENSK